MERLTQVERTALAEEKMISAAIDLLNSEGMAGATLKAIGERAGYSRGLATHHFGSKSGLLHKVLRQISAIWTEELKEKVGEKTGLQAIQRALDAHCSYAQRFAEHVRVMHILWGGSFDPASEFKPNVIEFHRLQRQAAAAWVIDGQASGAIRRGVDPAKFAEQFYASLLGIMNQWLVDPEIDLDASYDILKQNINALLEPKKPIQRTEDD